MRFAVGLSIAGRRTRADVLVLAVGFRRTDFRGSGWPHSRDSRDCRNREPHFLCATAGRIPLYSFEVVGRSALEGPLLGAAAGRRGGAGPSAKELLTCVEAKGVLL